MQNTASPRPAIKKVLDRHGDPIWITGGANAQDGYKPLHRCTACGGDVVWVKSKRTGKNYPTDVFRGYHNQRYYMKAAPHFTSCDERRTTWKRFAEHIDNLDA